MKTFSRTTHIISAAFAASILVLFLTGCPHPDDPGNGGGGVTNYTSTLEMKSFESKTISIGVGLENGPFYNASSTAPVTLEAFSIATTELTYGDWYDVYQWATSSDRGSKQYTFANKGREGSRGIVGAAPTADFSQPVTGISWRDAVVWCNALSEKKGLTPVYYVEGTTSFSDTSKVLRVAEGSSKSAGSGKAEKAVINPGSNGYRLPTEAEWEFAARGGDPDAAAWDYSYAGTNDESQLGTYAVYSGISKGASAKVKSKQPSTAGLYDMSGNVWEWCFNGNQATKQPYRGGSYRESDISLTVYSSNGNVPFYQYQNIGFRLAKGAVSNGNNGNNAGSGSGSGSGNGNQGTAMKYFLGDTVAESIGDSSGPFGNASSISVTVNSFSIAETELTYSEWYKVYQWATTGSRGYVFANAGREGDDGEIGAAPVAGCTEPVTSISWRDAVVWCNAASEREGLTPVYWQQYTTDFTDTTRVLREAESSSVSSGSGKAEKAVINPNADGYRLPTEAEWEYAARGGNPAAAIWNNTYAGTNDSSLLSSYAVCNANGTANVKSKLPNVAGLYDMSGNVWEWCYDRYSSSSSYWSLRGGSYLNSTVSYFSAYYRNSEYSYHTGTGLGFRVARNWDGTGTACNTGSGNSGTPVALGLTMKSLTGATVTESAGYSNGPFGKASTSSPVTVSSFSLAETELTYAKWYEVYQWATSTDRGYNGYVFANKGREGDDGEIGAAPVSGCSEPVTTISWRDAVVWCNAASEREGLTPVYWLQYTTDFTDTNRVLRMSNSSGVSAGYGKAENAVINPNANGYRLPTEAEWEYAARGGNPAAAIWYNTYAGTNDASQLGTYAVFNASGTSDVKSKLPNITGLYDMSGNVCEWCYDKYSSSSTYRILRSGSLVGSGESSKSVYNRDNYELPSFIGNATGFRVAQNWDGTGTACNTDSGSTGTPVALGLTMKSLIGATVTTSTGSSGAFKNASTTPVTVSSFRMAETEMTYAKWYEVYQWATSPDRGYGGYVFANKGQEGTSGTAGGAPISGSTAPVTGISWRDAVVWCNAASEREGLTPVYWLQNTTDFTDTTRVLRISESSSVSAGDGKAENAIINTNANGYRLPKEVEWEYAARGGNHTAAAWSNSYPGTNDYTQLSYYAVYNTSSIAGVKSKLPISAGLYDMGGNVREWCYDKYSSSSSYRILRGGSYSNSYSYCSVTALDYEYPYQASVGLGFRVARNY